MATSETRDRTLTDARRAWMTGGTLLILSSVLALTGALPFGFPIVGADVVGSACYAAALVIFAFGFRGSGSVTNRRPLGTVALVILAAWTVLWASLHGVIGSLAASDAGMNVTLSLGYANSLITVITALVAAVQIARASVVRRPWNWAPTWAVAATAIPFIVSQMLLAGQPDGGALNFAIALTTVSGLINIVGCAFLGVLAFVLSNVAPRTGTVPTFRPGGNH